MTVRDFDLDREWDAFKHRANTDDDCEIDETAKSVKSKTTIECANTDTDNGGNGDADIDDMGPISSQYPSSVPASLASRPTCTPIYISTTTKIAYLTTPIDIKRVFWEIPVVRYIEAREGVIKKQIKFSTTDRAEYTAVMERIEKERYADNQEMEHIDNPEGRIKFKDQRKISIGLSKKDILCYRSKKKRAFFNCFVLILRICEAGEDHFKEMHVKVFNTGKLEIPGIQTDNMLGLVLKMVVRILRPFACEQLDYVPNRCDTVLINSNFNCGFYINRDKLHDLLKYKYRINSNYDSCSYPGIQSKFYYVNGCGKNGESHPQTGQQPADTVDCCEISFMIFRTGSVLIVGKCTESVLFVIYDFLKSVLEQEYAHIVNNVCATPTTVIGTECDYACSAAGEDVNAPMSINPIVRKKHALKVQRRTIVVTTMS